MQPLVDVNPQSLITVTVQAKLFLLEIPGEAAYRQIRPARTEAGSTHQWRRKFSIIQISL